MRGAEAKVKDERGSSSVDLDQGAPRQLVPPFMPLSVAVRVVLWLRLLLVHRSCVVHTLGPCAINTSTIKTKQ